MRQGARDWKILHTDKVFVASAGTVSSRRAFTSDPSQFRFREHELVVEVSSNVMSHAQKPDIFFRRNGRVHLNRRGASVQSTTGSRGVRISGSNAGYTMFRGSVKGTGYPLHSPVSPSLPLPRVTVCHHISTGVYNVCTVLVVLFSVTSSKLFAVAANNFTSLHCSDSTFSDAPPRISLKFSDYLHTLLQF